MDRWLLPAIAVAKLLEHLVPEAGRTRAPGKAFLEPCTMMNNQQNLGAGAAADETPRRGTCRVPRQAAMPKRKAIFGSCAKAAPIAGVTMLGDLSWISLPHAPVTVPRTGEAPVRALPQETLLAAPFRAAFAPLLAAQQKALVIRRDERDGIPPTLHLPVVFTICRISGEFRYSHAFHWMTEGNAAACTAFM